MAGFVDGFKRFSHHRSAQEKILIDVAIGKHGVTFATMTPPDYLSEVHPSLCRLT